VYTAGAVLTLDEAFDNEKGINGATSEANAFYVGGATDYFTMWQEGANDLRIGTSAGANITIVPNGGTLALTGILTVSGATTITGSLVPAGGIDMASAAALVIGATNANAVTISKTGVTTTIVGALAVTQLATFNGGATIPSGQTLTVTGEGTGAGLVIPSHASTTPSGDKPAGSIFFEVDAKKLWVCIGSSTWVGTVLA
jgi:hypothetical protein